jgi:hypothetical protein
MRSLLGIFAVLAVSTGVMLGAATSSASDETWAGEYPNEETCEKAAEAYRSGDVGTKCVYRTAAEPETWYLWYWSIGG